MRLRILLLASIFALSLILRFIKLSEIPLSLSWDEAAIGWNAKTMWNTRRDEYGIRLPLSFKSFGDYKAPAYIYLTAPVVGILGMSEFSVRFVSAFSGALSAFVIFFITKEFLSFGKKRNKKQIELTALASSLFLAITPWHLLLSRPAMEASLAFLCILIGTWMFLAGVKKKSYLLLPSMMFFSLSFYCYHSSKIFVPIFILILFIIFWKKLFSKKTLVWTISSVLMGLAISAPIAYSTLFSKGAERFQSTSIFYTPEGKGRVVDLKLVSQIGTNYIIHYSPGFLFKGGEDNFRTQMKEVGPLLLIEAPFLIIGIIYLIKKRKEKWAQLLLGWLLVGPLPAIVGFETPHPIRAFNILPPLIIISAFGLIKGFEFIKGKQKRDTALILLGLLFLINSAYFLYGYFYHYPSYAAPDWQYGHKQVAKITKEYEDQVDRIIMTSAYGQPHIFMYFYQDRDPQEVFWGVMGLYLFRDLKWDEDPRLDNVLLVGTPEEIPKDGEGIVDEIKFPDGNTAFRIVKTKDITDD